MHTLRQHPGHNTELAQLGVPALQKIVDAAIDARDAFGHNLVGLIRQRFQDWRAYRQSVRELSALDDRILEDIGVHRLEIRAACRQVIAKRRGEACRSM
jgi:uncharacterized protein YjiS (DUF1127 family)